MQKRLDVPALIFSAFSVLYPLIAVGLLHSLGPTATVVMVLALLVARLLVPVLRGVPLSITLALVPVLIAMAAVAMFDQALSIRLYPVFMNAAMLTAFAITLISPPSMCERFARSSEPDLPPEGVRYTRNLTVIWVVFFAANGAIALWTALLTDWHVWTVYNGLIAYIAAGLLFGGEYLVRMWVRRGRAP